MKLFDKHAFENRIHEIDLFRGFLIFLVMFDHLMWSINFYIFHNAQPFLNWYWTSELRLVVQQIVLLAFLFTCGISCHFSKNNKKRGLLLLVLCLLITIVTHLLQLLPVFDNRVVAIDFNVLGVVCLSILAYCLFDKFSNKDLLLIVGVFMVFYSLIIINNKLNPDMTYNAFRSVLYCSFNPVRAGYVADYLPLFPYIIALFFGVLFARRFYIEKKSLFPNKKEWERPICFLGRHTLRIYIAHEILFTLIFMGVGALINA